MIAWALTCLGLMILPGPDMALVSRYTLSGGWRAGAATVFGIYISFFIYSVAIIFGLIEVIDSLPWFLDAARILGGCYLIFLSIQGLLSLRQKNNKEENEDAEEGKPHISAIKAGFISNALNAKQYLFLFLLLPAFASPGAGPGEIISLLLVLALVSISFWAVWIFLLDRLLLKQKTHHQTIEAISLVALFIVGLLLIFGII